MGAAVTDDNPKTRPWANLVRLMAQASAPTTLWDGPVQLLACFTLPRPKSLPKRVVEPVKKPDLDKLTRCIKDALKGVIYTDDAQVVWELTSKRYAREGQPPGVSIKVRRLDAHPLTL